MTDLHVLETGEMITPPSLHVKYLKKLTTDEKRALKQKKAKTIKKHFCSQQHLLI